MSNTKVISAHVTPEDFELIQRQCKAFIRSGLLPDHVWKGFSDDIALARAIVIAQKGRELGIPPLQAFASITVIGGKPAMSAELMLALIYQRCPGAKVTYRTPPEKQQAEAEFVFQRPKGDAQTFRFTLEDAQRAGITNNPTWKKYPAAMLRARCVSAGARAVFPDCIMGCYTPEELGQESMSEEIAEMQAVIRDVSPQEEKKTGTEIDDSPPKNLPPGREPNFPKPPPERAPEPEQSPSEEEQVEEASTVPMASDQLLQTVAAEAQKAQLVGSALVRVLTQMFGKSRLGELTSGEAQRLLLEFGKRNAPPTTQGRPPVGSDEDIRQAAEEGR